MTWNAFVCLCLKRFFFIYYNLGDVSLESDLYDRAYKKCIKKCLLNPGVIFYDIFENNEGPRWPTRLRTFLRFGINRDERITRLRIYCNATLYFRPYTPTRCRTCDSPQFMRNIIPTLPGRSVPHYIGKTYEPSRNYSVYRDNGKWSITLMYQSARDSS